MCSLLKTTAYLLVLGLSYAKDLEKQHQCTPYQSSFSDGCPPDDWCLGCTVCDCAAEGKWVCHVLSFCNEGERELLLQSRKVPLLKVQIKRVKDPNTTTSKNQITSEPKNEVKDNIPIPEKRKMQYQSSKKLTNNKKGKFTVKRQNTNNNKQQMKQNKIKLEQNKARPKLLFKKRNTTRKPQKRHMVKEPEEKTTMKQQPKTTRSPKQRSIRKKPNVARNKPQVQRETANIIIVKNSLEKSVLGRRLIKRIMGTVQKINEKKRMEKQQNNTSSKNKKLVLKKQKYKLKEMLYDYNNSRNNELKNYTQHSNFRKKREALDIGLSILELNEVDFANENPRDEDLLVRPRITKNVTPLDFSDSNNSTQLKEDSTLNNKTAVSTTEITSTTNKLLVLNSTPGDLLYYKYSIDKTLVNTSVFNESASNKDETNKTNIMLDSEQITDKPKNMTGINLKKAKLYTIIMSSEFNDLKHNKWQRMQILRDNNFKTNAVSKLNDIYRKVNSSNMYIRLINTIRRKDIKQSGVSNKYNLKTIIASNFKVEPSSNLTFTPSYNISSLQVILQNLFKELNKTTTTPKQRTSQLNLFKYLREIFKKIFSRKKGNLNRHKTNEGMTLEILCENIGACFMNKHNRIALRSKIHDLNTETGNIFRTIKNIKGLLYPIIMPIIVKENATKKFLNDDIQKLDAILKGTYANSSLTETQAGPINHVKKYIHQFIKSVGRFATKLNEILDVLYKNNKTYSCQRNTRLSQKKRKLNSLNKIKNLFVKYNIVQNTFMKKMYQLLTNVENNITTENPKIKVNDRDLNNTEVIDRYSKSIIENLRKLKNLAQVVNSSRKKRQTMREDDAIEYLLMLMEYLLKQNHPLDTAPVKDGIDLLIEAIENAPDTVYIKPLKKKVLTDMPTTRTPTRTTEEANVDLRYFTEDSNSASNRISKEEINLFKNKKHFAVKEAIDEINLSKNNKHSPKKEAIEKIPFSNNNKKSAIEIVDTEEDTTQNVYYKKYDDSDSTTVHDEYYTKDSTVSERKNLSEKVEKDKPEKTGFDKLESAIDYNNRRYEVFTSDSEDETIVPIVINTTEKPLVTTVSKLDTVEETTFVPLEDYKLDDDPVNEKKPKLDWIEENFSKEIREYRDDAISNSTKTITRTTQVVVTTAKPEDQSVDNISSITVEQEEEKKKKSKVSADDVMYRKQIEFLNSLDYGTEKTDFDDSGKDDEKYSSDGFSSYFIK